MKAHTDFTLELDNKVKHFLLTPKSSFAHEWLINNTNHLSQYWGKSLMVRRWEIEGLLHALDEAKLLVYNYTRLSK